MAGISILCLLLALGLHVFGWKRGGKKAYLASEPVHKSPVLQTIYDWAENRVFDLYEQGVIVLRACPRSCSKGSTGRSTSFTRRSSPRTGGAFTGMLRKAHTGHYANYLAWCLGG